MLTNINRTGTHKTPAQQKTPPYFCNRELACFNVKTDEIRNMMPDCNSNTADRVNKTVTVTNTQRGILYGILRPQMQKLAQQTNTEQKKLDFTNTLAYVPGQHLSNMLDDLKECTNKINALLSKMENNGVLNCAEYAMATWCILNHNSNVLVHPYKACYAALNDPHDHAFVVIINTYYHDKIEFVIDAWQSQIEKHQKAFIGTVDEFIKFANSNVDGAYIHSKININDIKHFNSML